MSKERLQKSKLMKLHLQSLDHLLEAHENNQTMDTELLFTRSFFMGLVSGIMLEKFDSAKPEELSLKAQKYIKHVPDKVQSGLVEIYAKMNQLIGEMNAETDIERDVMVCQSQRMPWTEELAVSYHENPKHNETQVVRTHADENNSSLDQTLDLASVKSLEEKDAIKQNDYISDIPFPSSRDG